MENSIGETVVDSKVWLHVLCGTKIWNRSFNGKYSKQSTVYDDSSTCLVCWTFDGAYLKRQRGYCGFGTY